MDRYDPFGRLIDEEGPRPAVFAPPPTGSPIPLDEPPRPEWMPGWGATPDPRPPEPGKLPIIIPAVITLVLLVAGLAAFALVSAGGGEQASGGRAGRVAPAETPAPTVTPGSEPARDAPRGLERGSMLLAANLESAIERGMRRVRRTPHGALDGLVINTDSIDIQFQPYHGRRHGVLVRDDGSTFVSSFKQQGPAHTESFSLNSVRTGVPERFVRAAAKRINRPVDTVVSLTFLKSGGELIWFAHFDGYKGDVRADVAGNITRAVEYP